MGWICRLLPLCPRRVALWDGDGLVHNHAATPPAVSDANFASAKLPSTLRQFKMVNDASIWSGNFTTFATFFLIYRVSIDLTEEQRGACRWP